MTVPEKTRQIKLIVAERFGITVEDIDSRRRPESITWPRHIAMYFTRKKLRLSFKHTGELFDRVYGDVWYARRRVLQRARIYKLDRDAIRTISAKLREVLL